MKVGSIVVCLPFPIRLEQIPRIKWLPITDKKTPYMVRNLGEHLGTKWITFEEGVIGIGKFGQEIALDSQYVKEILPPEHISKEIEEIIDNHQLIKI